MDLSTILMKTVGCILLCEQVSTSRYSYLDNQVLSNDRADVDVLAKFFVQLRKFYLEKRAFRHITIIDGSITDLLQQTRPLLENYPYLLCKGETQCNRTLNFRLHRGTYVIIFLDDFNKKEFLTEIRILRYCNYCRGLFISDTDTMQVDDVQNLVKIAKKNHILRAGYVLFKNNLVHLYTNFIDENCSVRARLIAVWKPGVDFSPSIAKALTFELGNFEGCPVIVTYESSPPKLLIREENYGSRFIASGREGMLLMELAARRNFTIEWKRVPASEARFAKGLALIYSIYHDKTELAIGRIPLRTPGFRNGNSIPYDGECLTWAVPRQMKWSNGILWMEFSWQVWASVGMVFLTNCAVGYIEQNLNFSNKGKERNFGFVAIILDNLAIHVENSVAHISPSGGGRFMLIVYLYYATVMTTAYKSSLAAILSTDESRPTIIDTEGILRENLTIGGSSLDERYLRDQAEENKIIPEILNRFVVNNNETENLNKLLSGQNHALLGHRSYLNSLRLGMIKSGEPVTFNVFDSCVVKCHVVIGSSTKSTLDGSMNDVIRQLLESGVLDYWDTNELNVEELLKRKSIEKYFEERGTDKFLTIFNFYFGCIAFCIITFFIELATKIYR